MPTLATTLDLNRMEKEGEHYYTFSFASNKTSTAILSQLRLVDSRRLMNKIGKISEKDFEVLKKRTCMLMMG